jgi:hypothetical protein
VKLFPTIRSIFCLLRRKRMPLLSGLGIYTFKATLFGISHLLFNNRKKPTMKKLLLLTSLFASLMLSSCHDSDNNQAMPLSSTITGNWKLTNVSGGIAGTNDDFADGLITWKFNSDHTVTITNNNTADNKQDILESGTYPYAFETNEATPELCAVNIVVGGTNLGCYTITPTQFTMSQVESDGFMIKLVR